MLYGDDDTAVRSVSSKRSMVPSDGQHHEFIALL